jgi:hypothetical protein
MSSMTLAPAEGGSGSEQEAEEQFTCDSGRSALAKLMGSLATSESLPASSGPPS